MATLLCGKGLKESTMLLLTVTLICLVQSSTSVATGKGDVPDFVTLTPQKSVWSQNPDGLDIYCYEGETRALSKAWTYSHLKLASQNVDNQYKIFIGDNSTEVYEKYKATMSSWLTMFKFMMSWDHDLVNIAPFKTSCIGIHSKSKFNAKLVIKRVDLTYFLATVAGIVLLVTADTLSKHVLFYYGMGMSVGLLGSVLVAVFILSRFIPKKTGAAAVFFGGSSIVLYLFRFVWDNMTTLVYDHKEYILAYLGITGLISWIYLYYRGPPTDKRSLNLLKWTIQLCGLLAMYWSVQVWEVTVCLLVAVVIIQNFPVRLLIRFKWWWQYKFPPKRRLLTHDEYVRQGEIETRKALAELREYCRSPDCDAWRTISRLKSPARFASFIEGDSMHVEEEEVDEHIRRSHNSMFDLTSDEDSESDT